MSTRRAKHHKERTHNGRLVREHLKEGNRGGLFDKRRNKVECRPCKFRRRAYYREKEHENEFLKKKLQRCLKNVIKKLGLDEPVIEIRTNKNDN